MSSKKIAQGFLLLSVAVLFDKTVPVFGIKLDVISLGLSVLFLIIALFRKELTVQWQKILPYSIFAALLVLSTIIGSLMSLHIFGTIPLGQIKTEYHILFGCLLIFFEIIILGMDDQKFLTWLVYAFLLSFILIVTPFIHVDSLQRLIGAKQYRFFGLIGDANYYPTFMTLPIVLLFYFLTKDSFAKTTILKTVFLYLVFSLSLGLIWWSGSRSGWLGILAGLLVFSIVSARNSSKKIIHFLSLTLIVISAVIVGHTLLPKNANTDISMRLTYISNPQPIAAGDNSVKIAPIIDDVSYSQDRVHIWEQGWQYFKQNPLGYGLVYYNIINIVSGDNHVSAHSFIVEMALIGGPLLLIIMFCVIGDVKYAFYKRIQASTITDLEVVLFASLVGFLVCSLFLSSLLLRWFWVQLALLITWQLNRGYTSCFSFRKSGRAESQSQNLEK